MRKVWMALGMILAAVLVAAGSFYAGMTYQASIVEQIRVDFMNTRGLNNSAQGQGSSGAGGQSGQGFSPGQGFNPAQGQNNQGPNNNTQTNGQARNFSRGGTSGLVRSLEGNILTVSTAQNVTTVNLSATTQIQKSVSLTASDLQPGMRITVIGTRDSQGNITASQVMILDSSAPRPSRPTPTRTAP